MNQTEIDNLVGFRYDNFSQLTWRHLEDHWTLLFIDSERDTNWGRHRPIIPIRIPVNDIAAYDVEVGRTGTCSHQGEAILELQRRKVPLGQTPVTARLTSFSVLE